LVGKSETKTVFWRADIDEKLNANVEIEAIACEVVGWISSDQDRL
jgi:hypothetical protein